MARHQTNSQGPGERLVLGEGASPVFMGGIAAAIVGLGLALVMGYHRTSGLRAFYFAYLTGFTFCLSIALGALFFVLMQHVTAAGWSVGVRRLAESVAALLPALGVLSIPILISVAVQNGALYRWALPKGSAPPEAVRAAAKGESQEEEPASAAEVEGNQVAPAQPKLDSITLQKRAWLNPWFFIVRVVGCFAIWSAMALWYRNQSVAQDKTRDFNATRRMQFFSGICIVILGLTLTCAAGDLLMSLDPHWYSTMFGVYYFAGSALVIFAVLILLVYLFQKAGYLRQTVTVEHYHDLGKYLFGFTFFWGYIAFSQYMLMWYASLPEEIAWFDRRGATTVPQNVTGWSWVIVAILFGQLLIPFAGLLSRHVKRRPTVLLFWAIWVLAFHWIDTYWMVNPEFVRSPTAASVVASLAATVGIAGVLLAVMIRSLAGVSLRPTADPRLAESLAFQNV